MVTSQSTAGRKRRKRRGAVSADDSLDRITTRIRQDDEMCAIPPTDISHPPDLNCYELALVAHSRLAIAQFCSAVRATREPATSTAFADISRLRKLEARFHLVEVARAIERVRKGRFRADPAALGDIRQKTGWGMTELHRLAKEGQQWMQISEHPYEGMLCFYLTERGLGIKPADYREMKKEDIPTFLALLDNEYIRTLCSVGKAFQDSRSGDDVEFRWESDNEIPDAKEEEEMLRLLEPFPFTPENIYEPSRYPDWPRPPVWPETWPWPADPTWIPNAYLQCNLCGKEGCRCVETAFPKRKPRIKRYGRYGQRGLGLQAVAEQAGEIAYKEGDLIGQLTGELVPLDSDDDTWTTDFARTDLDEAAAVCKIQPLAILRKRRVSGKWVMTIEAKVDIYDGAEITISYRATPDPCFCMQGQHAAAPGRFST
ncbi:hypothetical protein NKR23_g9011 [Pleurostoma richardsiae]|uniref:SET domain-containing protein n=1 Tax=Pleurostoma richardsiae TaxID=41990 RepID=A0AA38VCH6_9PEZI|nr:hypothetical protein NKR23_g9011 [Pleurostoma richardsiae]